MARADIEILRYLFFKYFFFIHAFIAFPLPPLILLLGETPAGEGGG